LVYFVGGPAVGEGVPKMPSSGKEMLKRYLQAGWVVISRRGSHVKVGKAAKREVIPIHKELKKGLERKLLKRIEGGP
jgi:predicted RNA binding protein YcfA (HicA-like mRNA interferase family)